MNLSISSLNSGDKVLPVQKSPHLNSSLDKKIFEAIALSFSVLSAGYLTRCAAKMSSKEICEGVPVALSLLACLGGALSSANSTAKIIALGENLKKGQSSKNGFELLGEAVGSLVLASKLAASRSDAQAVGCLGAATFLTIGYVKNGALDPLLSGAAMALFAVATESLFISSVKSSEN